MKSFHFMLCCALPLSLSFKERSDSFSFIRVKLSVWNLLPVAFLSLVCVMCAFTIEKGNVKI